MSIHEEPKAILDIIDTELKSIFELKSKRDIVDKSIVTTKAEIKSKEADIHIKIAMGEVTEPVKNAEQRAAVISKYLAEDNKKLDDLVFELKNISNEIERKDSNISVLKLKLGFIKQEQEKIDKILVLSKELELEQLKEQNSKELLNLRIKIIEREAELELVKHNSLKHILDSANTEVNKKIDDIRGTITQTEDIIDALTTISHETAESTENFKVIVKTMGEFKSDLRDTVKSATDLKSAVHVLNETIDGTKMARTPVIAEKEEINTEK